MPSYSEWAQRKPATSHVGDGTRPVARYSATDLRRVVSLEQLTLQREEAEPQAMLRDMERNMELHGDDAGSGGVLELVAKGRQQATEQLDDVTMRKERLVAVGAQHKDAGSLSIDRKCERLCSPT